MNILVTGGAGYLGSVLVELLARTPSNHIVVLDTFEYGAQKHNLQNIEYIAGDIRDTTILKIVIQNQNIIIHLAGLARTFCNDVGEVFANQVNVESTKRLIDLSCEAEIDKFIYASSCSVYGTIIKAASESSKLDIRSIYAKTKKASEDYIYDTIPDKSVILRLATLYGWSHQMRFDSILNSLILEAYVTKKCMIYGDGSHYRPFMHVFDAARFISFLLDTSYVGVYNTGQLNAQIRALVELLKVYFNGVKLVHKNNPNVSDRSYQISFDKMKSTGFKCSIPLIDGIEDLIERIGE